MLTTLIEHSLDVGSAEAALNNQGLSFFHPASKPLIAAHAAIYLWHWTNDLLYFLLSAGHS